jgi:hypothetical protein
MTDYTKLVKALRCENTGDDECGSSDCPYWSGLGCMDGQLMEDAADAIEAMQAQMPKRGEWVEENRRPRSSQFVCSECHRTAYDPQPTRDKAWRKRCRYAYCPNCGAKMEVQNADT